MADDAFLGRGWSFPPVFDAAGADVATVAAAEDVHQSLQILLSTHPGERIMEEGFGCDLQSMVFEEVDHAFANRMKQLIANAVLLYEPRVNLDSVDVEPDGLQGALRITISYTIRSSNSRYNMVFPFYVAEASGPGLGS